MIDFLSCRWIRLEYAEEGWVHSVSAYRSWNPKIHACRRLRWHRGEHV